jgi:hypothetical protein
VTLIACLVLQMVWEAHPTANRFEHRPHVVTPQAPDPPRPQWPWRIVCGQIGWALEYQVCRVRKA